MYRKGVLFFLSLIALWGVARFCHHQTKGFSLSKITHSCYKNSAAIANDFDLESLLSQKFFYLGRGKQSFAFVSEDGQTVIKLFNNRYPSQIALFHRLSTLPFLRSWALSKASYFRSKWEKSFESYRIAFEQLREETALLYMHLSPTQKVKTPLCLVDPLRIEHRIDLNQIGFVIQKKVDLFYPAFETLLQEGKMHEAKEALSSLVALFFHKYHLGIADNDPLIRTNYGLLGSQAVQIDVGPLSLDSSTRECAFQRLESERAFSSLKTWLQLKCPSLLSTLEEECAERVSSQDAF